ncbi:MAG: hypothetical protein E6Q97_01325 [Desulfurellales bacterium]|nr:MAG: hypothetical protein E6Q97_01325 [Desulfurellales bacterium]
MIEFIKSDSFRRIVAALIGILVPFLNKKLGMGLDVTDTVEVIAVVATYIAASNWKASAVAKADAHVEAAKTLAAAGAGSPPAP